MSRQSCATRAASRRYGPMRRSRRGRHANRERIGALVVSEEGDSVDGMLSERDIVIALGDHGAELLSRPIDEIMTRNIVTCDPADTVQD